MSKTVHDEIGPLNDEVQREEFIACVKALQDSELKVEMFIGPGLSRSEFYNIRKTGEATPGQIGVITTQIRSLLNTISAPCSLVVADVLQRLERLSFRKAIQTAMPSEELEVLRQLQEMASTLKSICPKSARHRAALQFIAGAILSVMRSVRFGYQNKQGRYELSQVFGELAKDMEISHDGWRSGFYFNNAIWRLMSLKERLGSSFPHSDIYEKVLCEWTNVHYSPRTRNLHDRAVDISQMVLLLQTMTAFLMHNDVKE